jgi:hypothetical protein
MGMISRVKSYAGHRAREALLYPAALMPRRAPRIMFFPSSTKEGESRALSPASQHRGGGGAHRRNPQVLADRQSGSRENSGVHSERVIE